MKNIAPKPNVSTNSKPVVNTNLKPSVSTNQNEALIAWKYSSPIPGCIGFAVYKRTNGEPEALAEPLTNRVGFADEKFTLGEERPSTEWPIQRFMWNDFSVKTGDKVQYMVVPILLQNGDLVKDAAHASAWSDVATVDTGTTYQAYFNRGLVASQFFSRTNTNITQEVARLSSSENGNGKAPKGKATTGATATDKTIASPTQTAPAAQGSSLKQVINGGPGKLRDFLGGCLSAALFQLLDDAINDKDTTIYAALYELKLDDLTSRLLKLGTRANLILANGTGKAPSDNGSATSTPALPNDENAIARAKLKGKINLFDRMVDTSVHFAHNKFMVVCKKGKPVKVLTGTTNWTPDGLFAQVNNSIVINDAVLAGEYLKEWNQIKAAGNDYPNTLIQYNTTPKVANPNLKAWCNPLPDLADLKDVEDMLSKAKNGFLFLLFNPGPQNTVFNTILDLIKTRPELYIRGVMNQDPGSKGDPLVFFDLKNKNATNWDVVLPGTIKSSFSFWYPDVSDGLVTIHSKSYVIDPFGDNPIVITGSNNGGPKASGKNDDNLVVIKGDKKLASEFAANILSVYAHYRWRYSIANQASGGFKGLSKDPNWMKNAMTPDLEKQVGFLVK